MRIAVSTDSGSGISQLESRELGIRVVPMPFRIDGKEYFEDISITREEFFEKLKNDCSISTSQPSPESVMKTWDELLEDHDAVIHVSLTAGLSGATQTAMMLSHEDKYEGRVFVPDSRGVSVTQRQQCVFAVELARKGYEPQQITEILTRENEHNSIYIAVDTLKYLKNGGRITPVAAAIGTLLHIKPVLTIVKGGKLDSYMKVRTMKMAERAIMDGIKRDLAEKHGDPDMNNCIVSMAYTDNTELRDHLKAELEHEFPNRLNPEIVCDPLSLLISCHIGQNGIGAAVIERPKELMD